MSTLSTDFGSRAPSGTAARYERPGEARSDIP
jgi:hypothetical protein